MAFPLDPNSPGARRRAANAPNLEGKNGIVCASVFFRFDDARAGIPFTREQSAAVAVGIYNLERMVNNGQ